MKLKNVSGRKVTVPECGVFEDGATADFPKEVGEGLLLTGNWTKSTSATSAAPEAPEAPATESTES